MGDVELLDSSLIPHFTEAEEAEYQRLVAAGKEAIKPKPPRFAKQYTDRQVDETVARTGKPGQKHGKQSNARWRSVSLIPTFCYISIVVHRLQSVRY